MSRGDRIPNPGVAGILVLVATALAPVAIRKVRPAARWVGKKLHAAAEQMDRIAEQVEREERERNGTEPAPRPGVKHPESKVKQENDKGPSGDLSHATASPHSQPEVEAQKTRSDVAGAEAKKASSKPRQKMAGATPPANNPKRTRKKPENPSM
jgi:hypothetical protein